MSKRSLLKYSPLHEDIHYIIELAWCDKTSFEMIKEQTGFDSNTVKKIMKNALKPSSYKLWRKRIHNKKRKNDSYWQHKRFV